MKASREIIEFIKDREAFISKPYQDSAGVWTIGYGHTRTATPYMNDISQAKAEKLLLSDIEIIEAQVNNELRNVKLRKCQFDAVVSFVFNIGIGNFSRSMASQRMKKNPEDKMIADSWLTWRNSDGVYLRGLLLRRLAELEIYFGW